MRRVYLDYNATSPVAPEVLEAMKPYFSDSFGNPSSLHAEGAKARKALEESRETIAGILKTKPDEIIFTSGGTEANNLAIMGVVGATEKKITFHSDGVQAVGKLPVDLSKLPVDLLSFSSHKIYGPKGVGGLFIRKGVKIQSQIWGGAQEMEKRGGTENLPGIVGFARAMQSMVENFDLEFQRVKALRDQLERGLVEKIPDLHVHGDERARLSNTLNVTMDGITSETILIALDLAGVALSSGSACASGSIEVSHVLLAMGISKAQAKGAVRFSLGRWTTKDDIEYAAGKFSEIVMRLRS
ncbi:MAG: cysteine desulfurase [Deltaproteobacteria bacterium]|nr:cysteine desulfurase [Deltaproteobacteria bacterium]